MLVIRVESRENNDEYSQFPDRPVANPRGDLDEIARRNRNSITIELHGPFTLQDEVELSKTTVIVFFRFSSDVDDVEARMLFLADQAVAPAAQALDWFYA